MKILSVINLLLIVTFELQAAEVALKECTDFEKNILAKAVTEVKTIKKDEMPFRFIKDEKSALEFIKKYDIKMLGLDVNKKNREDWVSRCKGSTTVTKDSVEYCQTSFPSFNFFRGLIYGIKHYGWKTETKDSGLEKLWSYLDEVRHREQSLLDLLMSMRLIQILTEEDLTKAVTKEDIDKLYLEAEKANDGLRVFVKSFKFSEQSVKCEELKKSIEAEAKVVKEFTLKLNKIIKK